MSIVRLRLGGTLRRQFLAGTALVAPCVIAALLPAPPALAACQPNGVIGDGLVVNCTGTDTVGVNGNDSNTVTVQPGANVTIGGGNAAFILHNTNTITNNGTINALDNSGRGIVLNKNNTATNNGSINVGAAGARGVEFFDSGNLFVNNGSLTALSDFTAFGVKDAVGAADNKVWNFGTISVGALSTAIQLNANTSAPPVTSPNIINAGAITAGDGGVGIYAQGNNTISNTGTITVGDGALATGVLLDNANNTLTNAGTIRAGASGYSVYVCNCATGTVVTNSAGGVLDGRINFDGNGNTLTNSGLITITNPNTPIGFPAFRLQPQFAAFTTGNTFVQTAQGTLALRMDNAGTIDTLTADSIQPGGTLKVVIQTQLYPATLITGTAVGLTGSLANAILKPFDSYVSSSPFFSVTPIYDTLNPNSYSTLSIQLDRIGFGSVPGSTRNQSAVGNALEGGYSPNLDPTSPAGRIYANLLAANSLSVLDQLSGQGTAAVQTASLDVGTLFNTAMQNQGLNGDLAGGTSVIIPSQYAETPRPRGQEAFASVRPADSWSASATGRWRIWTLGFGAYRSLDGNTTLGTASQSMHNYGGAMGIDRQIAPDLLLGASVGGSEASIAVPALSTTGQITAGHFGVYGVKTWGAFYGSAAVSYARLDNSTTRTITGIGPTETASGHFASDQLSGRLEVGWKRTFAQMTVTPFVAVEPAALWAQRYTETSTVAGGGSGILGLTYTAKTTTSLPTFVGLQFERNAATPGGNVFQPYARVSWVHEFQRDRAITANFINIPTTAFTVDGARVASDAARLEAGAKYKFDDMRSVFANVSGEWSGIGRSYAATAGFQILR